MAIHNNVATMLRLKSSLRIASCNIILERSYETDRNQEEFIFLTLMVLST